MKINKQFLPLLLLIVLFIHSAKAQGQTKTDSLEVLLKHTMKDTTRVNLLNDAAYKLYLIDIDQAFKYAEEAKDISIQINYAKGNAKSLILIGICYDEISDFFQALRYYENALEIYKELNDKNGIANCYNNIGIVYRNQGDYPRAMEYYLQALEIAGENGDQVMMSYGYNNIGVIYLEQGDYPKSLEYYQKSLKIDEELGDKNGVSYSLNNIGLIYSYQKDYPKALEYYQQSLSIKEELGDKSGMTKTYNNIAAIYKYLHEYSKAYEYYQKSLEINKEVGRGSSEANSYVGLSSLFFEEGKLTEANDHAKEAYNLAVEIGSVELIKESAELMAKSSNALGNYKAAYEYHILFKQMADSLKNDANTKKITQLGMQYEFDQEKALIEKENEKQRLEQEQKLKWQRFVTFVVIGGLLLFMLLAIVLYRNYRIKNRANLHLAEKYNEIKKLNEAKDKIFSVISHDLRGPVGVMKDLIDILLADINNFTTSELEELMETLSKQSGSIYSTLENLLSWANSQRKNIKFKPTKQLVVKAVNDNILLLEPSANEKGITLQNNIPDYLTASFDNNLISTVIRNLINNAIKFSSKEGVVTLSAVEGKEFHTIIVSDTGIGISQERANKIFDKTSYETTFGTNNEKGSGLGLKLCLDFVETNNGKIWVESEVGKGSDFCFTLPVN